MHESYKALIPLILPESIEEYFELTEVEKKDAAIHIYLKEVNKTPEEYSANKLHSKGFFEPITLQDFPDQAELLGENEKTISFATYAR
ncbi:hypothetical protein [Solitalea lacus]|uniref:ISAon1 family transposase N-terminal region protein n=1 Tax=Solitalea lacus TaxID=2911172 RepID=UPI001EDB0894|nr:hypothetical protein [Solitalea lacus]UKJ05849.1 hypothetical protein L2B55_09840 [Solitalea lacus]